MLRVVIRPGRLLILSDNLALVFALCKGRSIFHVAFSRKNRSWSEELWGHSQRDGTIRPLLERSLRFVKERAFLWLKHRRCPGCVFERLLCPRSSASPWFTASCCRDGSLVVIQPFWVQKTSEEPSSYVSVHPRFAAIVHASVRASGIEKEGYCPTACTTSPMLVGRSFRNWSVHQDRNQ